MKYKLHLGLDEYGRHTFYGEHGWKIMWSEEYQGFYLKKPDNMKGNPIAVYNDTFAYPMGLRKWHIENENCPGTGEKYLVFSSCLNDEFTCNNGQCIPIKWKCDKIGDCPDSSDEDDCKMVNLIFVFTLLIDII